jgi:DNA-binding NtrC family response regulator
MPQQNRILIADSCHLMRWSLDQTLGTLYHVDEVCTGEAALAALGSRRYEVLILGCGCSDLTCRELTLRSTQIQPELQVVLLGNLPPDQWECECHPIDTPCFYEKPLDLGELRGCIEAMMSAVKTP